MRQWIAYGWYERSPQWVEYGVVPGSDGREYAVPQAKRNDDEDVLAFITLFANKYL